MNNPFSLEKKTILVTGASSGIGRATAIECAKVGANVIITGRNEGKLNITYSQLLGDDHLKLVADFDSEDEITELVNKLPVINGLVNAAGVIKTLPFQYVNKTDLNNIFNINFLAPVLLSQKIIKSKKFEKNSSIVFISSIDGPIIGHIGNSMYSASKGAINAIVKNMALDLAPKKIRVNCVLPGMVDTPLINIDNLTEEQLNANMRFYPLNRYGRPEEVAYAVIYFLSEASNWVTGSNLIIDGGYTLH